MVFNLLTKVFGSKNERELKQIQPLVDKINALEPEVQALQDEQLKARTAEFRQRLDQGETIEDLLPEAFATVREASIRTLNMRHFDAQLIGGIVLHQGRIAEMKTGEGKTLAATLPAYLNALSGKGVHIITVNDYLARRDTEWMGHIYRFLGLSVGTVMHGLDDAERLASYGADITYGTNNEFGFDYLRDNMKFDRDSLVQGELNFAVVDEVDSILIDEARTPLIISGPAEKSTDLYYQINGLIPRLSKDTHYTIDEKARSAILSEEGVAKAENLLKVDNIFDPKNIELLHHINQALKAHALFKRDVDYIVKDGGVIIVDEFTGRLMPGRRYSEGLHQALEAKENVKIENENQTLATITFQNYFRMYTKLSGMTGTADTEAAEFKKIYDLDVVVIPTNMPMVRRDAPDVIYKTRKEKFNAALDEIVELHKKGQPVLVGTISIDVSEDFSKKLKKRGIKHTVLNAKNHEKEAEIIAQAGQMGAVTISTNMAGRGTDIVLGDGVTDLGGLHILGTERHESRRIDNQLRGRSGRQGDPGSTRFYLSMEDNLMRIFANDRVRGLMQSIGLEDGEAIEHRMVNNAIEKAQRKVEGHNFDIRKNLLDYDDVSNDQRQVIYQQRRDLMATSDISETIEGIREEVLYDLISEYIPAQSIEEQWDIEGLEQALETEFASQQPLRAWLEEDESLNEDTLSKKILEQVEAEFKAKEQTWAEHGVDMRMVEKQIMLQILDQRWKEHLATMDHLRASIGLRAYAQKQPKQEYKRESFELFQELLVNIKRDVVQLLSRVQIEAPEAVEEAERKRREEAEARMRFTHAESSALNAPQAAPPPPPGARGQQVPAPDEERVETFVREEKKVGRNEPCPCGSGKKFKHCHGKAA